MDDSVETSGQYASRFTTVLKQLLKGGWAQIEKLRLMLEGVQNLVSRNDERYNDAPQFWNDLENIFERVATEL